MRCSSPKRASKGTYLKGRSIRNFSSLCSIACCSPFPDPAAPSAPIRHSAIATTLFGAALLGSFFYTVKNGRSAYADATSLVTGTDAPALPTKASYTYQMKFR